MFQNVSKRKDTFHFVELIDVGMLMLVFSVFRRVPRNRMWIDCGNHSVFISYFSIRIYFI